jgi:hypothetical protein
MRWHSDMLDLAGQRGQCVCLDNINIYKCCFDKIKHKWKRNKQESKESGKYVFIL